MVTYTTNALTPGKSYFDCEKMRATLSTDSCAGMWRKADDRDDGAYSACRLCPIGAVHAGEVAASMSPLKGTLTCARCHRGSPRLIGSMLCVSCYNRAREFILGKNAKGTSPVKLAALDARRVVYRHGNDVRMIRLKQSIDTDELVVAVLRDSKSRVQFAFNTTPPAAIRQARLW
jgi:hypothetical protein